MPEAVLAGLLVACTGLPPAPSAAPIARSAWTVEFSPASPLATLPSELRLVAVGIATPARSTPAAVRYEFVCMTCNGPLAIPGRSLLPSSLTTVSGALGRDTTSSVPTYRGSVTFPLGGTWRLVSSPGIELPKPDPTVDVLAPCGAAVERVSAMSAVVVRQDRIAAKRMTAGEFLDGTQGQLPISADAGSVVCVIAVAGDIRPSGQSQVTSSGWAVFVSTEADDSPLGAQFGAAGTWPTYFEALPAR